MCNYEKAGEVAHAIVQSESSKCQPSVQVPIFFARAAIIPENDKKLEWHDPPRFGVSQCALPKNCPSATWLARGQFYLPLKLVIGRGGINCFLIS